MTPYDDYQEAVRDCAALVTLHYRALVDHLARHLLAPGRENLDELVALRQRLYEALIPTRHCPDETTARTEVDALIAQIRSSLI